MRLAFEQWVMPATSTKRIGHPVCTPLFYFRLIWLDGHWRYRDLQRCSCAFWWWECETGTHQWPTGSPYVCYPSWSFDGTLSLLATHGHGGLASPASDTTVAETMHRSHKTRKCLLATHGHEGKSEEAKFLSLLRGKGKTNGVLAVWRGTGVGVGCK